MVQIHPPQLDALMVKRRSWLPPKEQVQVRFLAGVLQYPRGVVEARDPAKVEGEVQLLTGILAQRGRSGGYGVVALHATL